MTRKLLVILLLLFSISLCFKENVLSDFTQALYKKPTIIYTNSVDLKKMLENITYKYNINTDIKIINKQKVTYVSGVMFVFKDQIKMVDGKIYSLSNYNPKKNECYILYTEKNDAYVFVIKGNLNLFQKYIETVPEYVVNTKEIKISNDPIIIKLETDQKIIYKEEPSIFGKLKNFFSSIISKSRSFIINKITLFTNFITQIIEPEQKRENINREKLLDKLYWSGVFNILKKVNSKQDIERLIPYAKKFVKENAYAHNFPELEKYINNIKEKCITNGKLKSECVYYNSVIQLNIKPIQNIVGMMDEDIQTLLKRRKGDCGGISLLMAAIYRDLNGYDLSVPEGYDMNLNENKEMYEKYKNKKHINIGKIKYVYIIAGKDHAFLIFCNKKFNKLQDIYLKKFVNDHCKIVDSVSYNPLRPPKEYYDPDYYKMIITEDDICFYTDKSVYDYYTYNYGKQYYDQYIGIPVGYQICCLSDF